MKTLLRELRLPLSCLLVAGLIGIAAIVDHRNKMSRLYRAEVAEWFCAHQGKRCGGPSSDGIEASWQARQWGYEIAVVVIGGFGVVALGRRVLRRRLESRRAELDVSDSDPGGGRSPGVASGGLRSRQSRGQARR
jgi:hypothetical protein